MNIVSVNFCGYNEIGKTKRVSVHPGENIMYILKKVSFALRCLYYDSCLSRINNKGDNIRHVYSSIGTREKWSLTVAITKY